MQVASSQLLDYLKALWTCHPRHACPIYVLWVTGAIEEPYYYPRSHTISIYFRHLCSRVILNQPPKGRNHLRLLSYVGREIENFQRTTERASIEEGGNDTTPSRTVCSPLSFQSCVSSLPKSRIVDPFSGH